MGAQVLNFEPQQHFASDELPLLDRYLQFAVVAAREALLDAGLGSEMINNAAAIIGTGCGGKHTDEASDDILYKQQRSRAHPLTIPKGMPSAAASMVSMLLGIRGPAFPFTSVRASGTHATVQI
jgi:nodulation protein E